MLINEDPSTQRLIMLEQSYHGASKNSVLSREGFVKKYSKPANPTEHLDMPYDTPVIDYIAAKKEAAMHA